MVRGEEWSRDPADIEWERSQGFFFILISFCDLFKSYSLLTLKYGRLFGHRYLADLFLFFCSLYFDGRERNESKKRVKEKKKKASSRNESSLDMSPYPHLLVLLNFCFFVLVNMFLTNQICIRLVSLWFVVHRAYLPRISSSSN